MPFSRLLTEFGHFAFPLRAALQTGENFSRFWAAFGIDVEIADADDALGEVGDLADLVDELSELIDTALAAVDGDPFDISDAEKAEIALKGTQLYEGVDGLVAVGGDLRGIPFQAAFAKEILDRLIDLYLAFRMPVARVVLQALGARTERDVAPADPDGRDIEFTLVTFDFSRIGQVVSDTGTWAAEVYGWNTPDFDPGKVATVMAELVQTFGGQAFYEISDTPDVFVSNRPSAPPPATGRVPVYQVRLPLVQDISLDQLTNATVNGEAGLVLLPFGDMSNMTNVGMALAPYAEGSANQAIALSDMVNFSFEAEGQAVGGRSITIQPSGVGTVGTGATNASFAMTLSAGRGNGTPIVLIGEADGTRIETQRMFASVGGSMDGDFFIAGGMEGLAAVIDPGEDGLLSAILSDAIRVEAGDILMGFRHGRGLYFEGGSSLELQVPLDIDLHVMQILGLELRLDWSETFAIDITVEGELEIGPLFAYADGIGVRAEVVEEPGLLGDYDLDFSFLPPNSYAVSLDIAPIEGGGLIERNEFEYRGALALKFEKIGFSAFGILNTRLPGGQPGFSFAASIFGEFNVPLGFGFFLTGLGGMIGINRTIDTDAMRDVLFEGRFDTLLFPTDPIANASTILDDMAAILPARAGQHVMGPVARIGWGVPTLIRVKLGVVIEVGDEVRLLILGGLSCELPDPDVAVVKLNVAFFGEIDFSAGTVSFDATLQNSRILTFTLSGDAALRTGWAARLEHVVSFGGLHPQFPRPANLPDLRRISIDFGTNNPRVTISGYTALTTNSLQFGADARIYAKGPKIFLIGRLAAEGWAYFHALITFDPFAFLANLGGGINLLRNGSVVCGLGFDLTLSGPNRFRIDGKVWVTVFGQDIDFRIRHSWGSQSAQPSVRVNAGSLLREALERATIEPVAARGDRSAVRFRGLEDSAGVVLDPLGGARVSQSRLPLDVRLDKVGEAQIDGARRFDIQLRRDGVVQTGPVSLRSDFVHGHFFNISKAEKLRATVYDRLKSGVELARADLDFDAAHKQDAEYAYEVFEIPHLETETSDPGLLLGQLRPQLQLKTRYARAARLSDIEDSLRAAERIRVEDALVVNDPRFAPRDAVEALAAEPQRGRVGIAGRTGGGPADVPVFETFAEAELDARQREEMRFDESGVPHTDARVVTGGRGGAVPEYVARAAL